jgi:hypothetical protein
MTTPIRYMLMVLGIIEQYFAKDSVVMNGDVVLQVI